MEEKPGKLETFGKEIRQMKAELETNYFKNIKPMLLELSFNKEVTVADLGDLNEVVAIAKESLDELNNSVRTVQDDLEKYANKVFERQHVPLRGNAGRRVVAENSSDSGVYSVDSTVFDKEAQELLQHEGDHNGTGIDRRIFSDENFLVAQPTDAHGENTQTGATESEA